MTRLTKTILAASVVVASALVARRAMANDDAEAAPEPDDATAREQSAGGSPARGPRAAGGALVGPEGARIRQLQIEQNRDRARINEVGMSALLGWAALNIAVGTVGNFTAEGRWKYAHQMNAIWNVVNAGIGLAGWLGARSEDPSEPDTPETIRKAYSIEKILLFNAGLDLGYVAAGAFLNERGLRDDSDRLVGYGRSVMVQGAFLFAFDLVMFWVHHRNTRDFIVALQPAPRGAGLSLVGRF